MEKISWCDRVRNDVVLHGVKDSNILDTIKRIGLFTSCVGTVF
jgi:hypothetical protein